MPRQQRLERARAGPVDEDQKEDVWGQAFPEAGIVEGRERGAAAVRFVGPTRAEAEAGLAVEQDLGGEKHRVKSAKSAADLKPGIGHRTIEVSPGASAILVLLEVLRASLRSPAHRFIF